MVHWYIESNFFGLPRVLLYSQPAVCLVRNVAQLSVKRKSHGSLPGEYQYTLRTLFRQALVVPERRNAEPGENAQSRAEHTQPSDREQNRTELL